MTERNRFQIAAAEMAASFEAASRPDGCGDFIRRKDGAPKWVRDAVREAAGGQGEFADGEVDIYNSDRAKWLAAHDGNAEYMDEARRDFGPSEQGIMGDIGQGQYRQAKEIYGVILRVVVERSEELYPDAV